MLVAATSFLPHMLSLVIIFFITSSCMILISQCTHPYHDPHQSLDQKEFTNEFAVHIDGSGLDADQLAAQHGFVNKGQIGSLDGHYLFVHDRLHKRSLVYADHHHSLLQQDPMVLWVEQQHVKRRRKRDGSGFSFSSLPSSSSSFAKRNRLPFMPDPLFTEQWYLNHGGRGGFDMNVAGAWAMGYTGKKVVVSILDDGIQPDHPDLLLNYDPRASYDINDNDPDPTPQDNGDNKHGTRCAGEVAAQAFNEFCGVGIAYNASVGGVRMLDGTVTDQVEARALSLNPDHIDIYSASWGPEDDGKTVDGPGRLTKRAFVDGVRKGRRGLGSIFVWASGNGGRKQDNCNCDGYTNSIYTLSISSATQSGTKPWYLEECSSTLATTYSSGSPGQDQNIVTVDMDTTYKRSMIRGDKPVTTYLCTLSHTGTSASAPIGAAIAALALEANPNLTWRDMQHIVIATSRPDALKWESGWQVNGIGRSYSHKFGYGLMDAEGMVRLAEVWRTVGPQRLCESAPMIKRMEIPVYGALQVRMSFDACRETNKEIRFLEHVQARLTLKFKPRGNLKITLISPSGTLSTLLSPRIRDEFEDTFNEWPFLSVHYWGENPAGVWELRVENSNLKSSVPGSLLSWQMVVYGTYDQPETVRRNHSVLSLPRRSMTSGDKLMAQDMSSLSGIRGVVRDGGRNPLTGVMIEISGMTRSQETLEDGSYWRILDPGNYTVTFSKIGYDSWSTEFTILPSGVTKWINVTLTDELTHVHASNATDSTIFKKPSVSFVVVSLICLTIVIAAFCLTNAYFCGPAAKKSRKFRMQRIDLDEYSFDKLNDETVLRGEETDSDEDEEELFNSSDVIHGKSKNVTAT